MSWKLKQLKFIIEPFPTESILYAINLSIFCNSSKKRKEYLVLTCGPPSVNTSVPEGKSEDGDSSSDEDSSEDEENQTVSLCYYLFIFWLNTNFSTGLT